MDQSYFDQEASSDEALILRIKQGDKEAYAVFYERHRTAMYLSAYHLLRDDEDARDAVQELFVTVWQHADRIDSKGNIKGYLYTVLRNRILTAMSRSKYLDGYINSLLAFEQQSVSTTEETVLARELAQLLEKKSANCHRKCVKCTNFLGMTTSVIGRLPSACPSAKVP